MARSCWPTGQSVLFWIFNMSFSIVSCLGEQEMECVRVSLTKICWSPSSGLAWCALVREFSFVECTFCYKCIWALRTAASCAAVAVNCSGSVYYLLNLGNKYQISAGAKRNRSSKFRREIPGTYNSAFTWIFPELVNPAVSRVVVLALLAPERGNPRRLNSRIW